MPLSIVHSFLKKRGLYSGPKPTEITPEFLKAIDAVLSEDKIKSSKWDTERKLIGVEQLVYLDADLEVGPIDGLVGEQTRTARALYKAQQQNTVLPVQLIRDLPKNKLIFPKQNECLKYYGNVGENQTTLKLPYKMKLAWDRSKTVSSLSCHEKVHDSMLRCFERIANSYDSAERAKLGLDLFGGCLNVRKMRGGSSWSMHSWGIAIDFDPDRNQLQWGMDRARLAKPDCETFWKIWEDEGWVSLGRSRNFDWMHVQAARF